MTLTFKIQIRGIKQPPVWRRIEIPAELTFHDLHWTIQKAFGWENAHLYQFQKQPYDRGWTVSEPDPDGDYMMGAKSIDSRETVVGPFLKEKKLTKLVYVYDFGDDWIHDMTLEKTSPEVSLEHPVCLAGKGACPPEDVGGPWGYEEMKHLLAEEPDGEETQSYMDWLGLDDPREFDPEEFDRDNVNFFLKHIKPKAVSQQPKPAAPRKSTNSPTSFTSGLNDLMHMMDHMEKMTENLSDEDKDDLVRLMMGQVSMPALENARFYCYKKPDYSAKAARVIDWLGPFWNAQNDDDKRKLCHFVEDYGRQLSRKEQADELRGYMFHLFDAFDPEAPGNRWRLLGPLWIMERSGKMDGAIELLLEALRQDAFFIYAYVLPFEEVMTAAVYQLGRQRIDLLERFLYEQGLIPTVKPVVLNALLWALQRNPGQQLRITSMLVKFMNHCLDICLKGASPMNLEQYAIGLATAHVTETMPILRKIYEQIEFPYLLAAEGIDEIERCMNDPDTPFCCHYDALDQYLNDEEEMHHIDYIDQMGTFGQTDYLDNVDDDDPYIQGYYDTLEKPKRYEVHVEHGSEWRLLQIPSALTLDGLAQLVMLAFGADKRTKKYEFQNLTEDLCYLSDADDYAMSDEFWDIEPTDLSTLSELLMKRGEAAEFRLKKNKKVSDTYILTLKKEGRYTDRTLAHPICLLDADDAADQKAISRAVGKFGDKNPMPPTAD
ncbi:MAG: plasmid pRiA4b ORF-3 family protein [Prevotella sp.]|nr:plasmid pRiA4b ORF-3 family protein [Prevotella sp.]